MRRSGFLILVLAILLGFLGPVPQRAFADAHADEHGAADAPKDKAGSHGDSGHGGEKHENDLFGKALDLGIWTIVVFLLLFIILRKYAWGPILEGLQKRESNIHDALDEAQKAQKEAQALRDQHQQAMSKAQEEVLSILDQARKDAQRSTEELIGKARDEIQSERDRLRREIDIAKDQALQHLWNRTADLATLAAGKAIRKELNAGDHRRLVDEALTEIRQAGANVQGKI